MAKNFHCLPLNPFGPILVFLARQFSDVINRVGDCFPCTEEKTLTIVINDVVFPYNSKTLAHRMNGLCLINKNT